MRRRRKHKRMSSMSIICITAIVGLSAMGVGYGYWNDNLNIGVGISTGYLKPVFDLEDFNIIESDGEVEVRLSDDKTTLIVEGWIYPSFNNDIDIYVGDKGSVPVIFDSLDLDIGNENLISIDNNSQFKLNLNQDISDIEEPFLEDSEIHDDCQSVENPNTVSVQSFMHKIKFKHGL